MKNPKEMLPVINLLLVVLGLAERLLPAYLVYKNGVLTRQVGKLKRQKRRIQYELEKNKLEKKYVDNLSPDYVDIINKYLKGERPD